MITDYQSAEVVTKFVALQLKAMEQHTVGLRVVKASQTDEHYSFHMKYLGERFYVFVE